MASNQPDIPGLRTNRDLYLFIAGLKQQHPDTTRSLEEYLRALWRLCEPRRDRPFLSLDDFASLLAAAFDAEPAPFDPAWRRREFGSTGGGAYDEWNETILDQIVDLREMDEHGALRDKWRYLGVDAPSGKRWFNFDPLTYLECAAEGTFGGWEPGDETGRSLVPGEVAVLDANGNLVGADPRDLGRPKYEMSRLNWNDFTQFLRNGQYYE
jgi:hypothetical protein